MSIILAAFLAAVVAAIVWPPKKDAPVALHTALFAACSFWTTSVIPDWELSPTAQWLLALPMAYLGAQGIAGIIERFRGADPDRSGSVDLPPLDRTPAELLEPPDTRPSGDLSLPAPSDSPPAAFPKRLR
jgi:hypothetical protein